MVVNSLRESAELYLSSKNIPDFERVRSSSSFQKLQEHRKKRDITDSPISHKPRSQLEDTPAFVTQDDEVMRKETQIKISKGKLKSNNELFILKLVFESLDKVKAESFINRANNHRLSNRKREAGFQKLILFSLFLRIRTLLLSLISNQDLAE